MMFPRAIGSCLSVPLGEDLGGGVLDIDGRACGGCNPDCEEVEDPGE